MTDAPVLDLTTEVLPAKKILLDGEEYDLLSLDHLSPEDEASVTATFARFQKVFGRLENAKNESAATAEAMKLGGLREKLILKTTSIPRDVLKKLSPGLQGKILRAVQNEISVASDDEDDDDGVDTA